jgi:hypothetical protein
VLGSKLTIVCRALPGLIDADAAMPGTPLCCTTPCRWLCCCWLLYDGPALLGERGLEGGCCCCCCCWACCPKGDRCSSLHVAADTQPHMHDIITKAFVPVLLVHAGIKRLSS